MRFHTSNFPTAFFYFENQTCLVFLARFMQKRPAIWE
jgi:hypothetical protein